MHPVARQGFYHFVLVFCKLVPVDLLPWFYCPCVLQHERGRKMQQIIVPGDFVFKRAFYPRFSRCFPAPKRSHCLGFASERSVDCFPRPASPYVEGRLVCLCNFVGRFSPLVFGYPASLVNLPDYRASQSASFVCHPVPLPIFPKTSV